MFAREQIIDLIEINLERHLELKKAFSTLDIRTILLEIEGLAGKLITPGKSLLFFDEIQAVPEALAALRYFYEDVPHLAVLTAGSLLAFALSTNILSMPVGRIEYLHLGPMTFHEFLLAVDPYSAEQLMNLPIAWKNNTSSLDIESVHTGINTAAAITRFSCTMLIIY